MLRCGCFNKVRSPNYPENVRVRNIQTPNLASTSLRHPVDDSTAPTVDYESSKDFKGLQLFQGFLVNGCVGAHAKVLVERSPASCFEYSEGDVRRRTNIFITLATLH